MAMDVHDEKTANFCAPSAPGSEPPTGRVHSLLADSTRRPVVRSALLLTGLATAYYVMGKLGLRLAFFHPSATAVWPPTGVALAAVLFLGRQVWPAIFCGAFLVNYTTAGSVGTSCMIAVGNTLEAVLGGALVSRYGKGGAFEDPYDVFKFALLAGLVATPLSATVGVSSLSFADYADWERYPSLWVTWWLGDFAGALILCPAILLWVRNSQLAWKQRQALEALVLLGALAAIGLVVFGPRVGG